MNIDLVSALKRIELAHGKVGEFEDKDNGCILTRINKLLEPDKEEVVSQVDELINKFYNGKES